VQENWEPVERLPVLGHTVASESDGSFQLETPRTLAFSVLQDMRPMIETLPLDKATEAFARMMDGKARFRMVLVNGKD
jgi:D-arabinose 1-dehydrogenase-like Zn-dependent alcohol dehydrogenase